MKKQIIVDGVDRVMATLTEREQTVLKLVSSGLSNKEIAFALELSLGTVKTYVQQLIDDSGFANRVQIARWAWFYPRLFEGATCDLLLHLPGCLCPHPRCVLMLAMDADAAAVN